MSPASKSLNWSQRIALIRHTLHAAVRSGDFTFFKTLQAQAFMEGLNYVGLLTTCLGEEADTMITALDDLNAALAQVYEDACKTIFTKWKHLLAEKHEDLNAEQQSNLFVDFSMQRQTADMAIDKTVNSAISLIEEQPSQVQETAASIWIGGVAIVADAIEICLRHMTQIDKESDFIKMEHNSNMVTTSVACSISALRGIYNLMENCTSDSASDYSQSRSGSTSAASGMGVFRRLSNAFTPPSPAHSRSSSINVRDGLGSWTRSASASTEHRNGSSIRSSISSACPGTMPERFGDKGSFPHTSLSTIPPTPGPIESVDPFTKVDLFGQESERSSTQAAIRDVVMA